MDPSAEALAAMQKAIYTPYMPYKHIFLLDSKRWWPDLDELQTVNNDLWPSAVSFSRSRAVHVSPEVVLAAMSSPTGNFT